jgi:hypothetical protein
MMPSRIIDHFAIMMPVCSIILFSINSFLFHLYNTTPVLQLRYFSWHDSSSTRCVASPSVFLSVSFSYLALLLFTLFKPSSSLVYPGPVIVQHHTASGLFHIYNYPGVALLLYVMAFSSVASVFRLLTLSPPLLPVPIVGISSRHSCHFLVSFDVWCVKRNAVNHPVEL